MKGKQEKNQNKKGVARAVDKFIDKQGKKKVKGVQQNKMRAQKSGGVNSYLQLLINPATAPLCGIPDVVTTKSVKFRTKHRFVYSPSTATVSQTWAILAFAPTLYTPIFIPGGNADGSTVACVYSSADLGVTYNTASAAAGVQGAALMSAGELSYIQKTFSAVRPVAMSVDAQCVGAITTLTGEHGMGLAPAETIIGGDATTTATGGLFASGAFKGASGFAGVSIGSIGAAMDGADAVTNIAQPVRAFWSPQDTSDTNYIPVNNIDADNFAQFTNSTWKNTTTTNDAVYVLPFGVARVTNNAAAPVLVDTAFRDASFPAIVWAANGILPGTGTPMEFTVNTCWEGLPIYTLNGMSGETVSPSNPDEMTQASNVLALTPNGCAMSVDNPQLQVQEAASKTAEHLYDGTPRKEAVEGTSITKALGGALGMASPLLAAIPGVGGPLAVGAGLISSLLSNL
jgi:hypothetical protein